MLTNKNYPKLKHITQKNLLVFLICFCSIFFQLTTHASANTSTTTPTSSESPAQGATQGAVQSATCSQQLQTIKNLCTQCRANLSGEVEFNNEKLSCAALAPLHSGATMDYFFPENKVNCLNYQKLYCEPNTATPKLIASNSEFFNVTDPQTGILANQNSQFLKADSSIGPILGPIYTIINLLISLIGTLTILAIVYGSFLLVTARGEDDQISRGKEIIKNSIIAIVIVLTSFTLVRLTQALVFNLIN